ncbi:MAG: hypothetical protein EON58_02675 [Alphaproteobacteria bacterium]|nr:MAG: hypothetical protein EON58_02675 [Alphaproteobacteria bacterium]
MSKSEIDLSPLAHDIRSNPGAQSKDVGLNSSRWDLSAPEALERPLFSPSRRDFVLDAPAPEPVVQVVEEAIPEPRQQFQVKLQGTRTIAGRSSALVDVNNEGGLWVDIGDDVVGWTVSEISPGSLVLSHGPERLVVELYPTVGRD